MTENEKLNQEKEDSDIIEEDANEEEVHNEVQFCHKTIEQQQILETLEDWTNSIISYPATHKSNIDYHIKLKEFIYQELLKAIKQANEK